MASIKVKFRASHVDGKEGSIYYQVIQSRNIRQISTDYKIFANEWDDKREAIIISQSDTTRNRYLSAIRERIKLDQNRLRHIISALNKSMTTYTADDIVKAFKKELKGQTVFLFMQGVIMRFRELRKVRSVETYSSTLSSFMKFREGEDLLLTDISSDLMISYEAYLKHNGVSMNTISFYMRILRAVYNRAAEQELVEQRYPFKKVYTGIDKTVKRALPLKSIKQIKDLDLSLNPKMAFARDLFMLSFYTRGMSFVDMAYLRKKDLQNGVITYRRRKTGQRLHIKWEKCMQEIISRYPHNETEYLLPIITMAVSDERSYYRNVLSKINIQLKKIAKILALQMPITMYTARHSWGSIAKSQNIPISVISQGMGHDSEATTQIYLASLDTAVVDKANHQILKLL